MAGRIVTVSELTGVIKSLIESAPGMSRVSVRGELSNYKVYPSGHHYFTLKDSGAALKCVMFRQSASKLSFRPENGMSVTCSGDVSVYPRDGVYQLYVTGVTRDGIGDLYIAFEELKAKLQKEGLFNDAAKKALPEFPNKIAVITSDAGAAVHDILRILGRRWPMADVVILPVRVQGAEAPAEIAEAIDYANRWSVADLIITGRGGGSIEDLWAFNDEHVARAIFRSKIPVISAVGHEPDITISDYVADRRAATPSNAAEIAVPDCGEIADILDSLRSRMIYAEKKNLEISRRHVELDAQKLEAKGPLPMLSQKRLELDSRSDKIFNLIQKTVMRSRQEYSRLAAELEAMSPVRVLARGYALATDEEGVPIRDAAAVSEEDRIRVILQHGSLLCSVEEKQEV